MNNVTFILDTRRPLQDGTFPVKLSVGNGTRLYLSTGVSVKAENFVAGQVEGTKDAKRLNGILDTQRLRVKARLLLLKEDGKLGRCSATHLRKLLTAPDMDEVPEEDRRTSFWTIAERCIATKDGRTKDVYMHTLAKLRAFAGDGPLYIEDIDRVWLHGFDASIGGKVNSRGIHLRNLRAICNFALDEELTTHYPFRKYKIKTEETRKKALTLEQVRAFMAVPGPNEYRDVFILMLYLRGINVSDLAELTEEDVVGGRIEYRRNKTGQLYSIKVEPEAQEILDRWKGEAHLLRCFDRYKDPHDYNRRMREALKKMRRPDGTLIEKDCSSNWARHTWATMCAELDVPDPTISLGMGHRIAGHRTTAIYIKRDQRKVDEANRLVIDYVKGNRPASLDAGRA
ncbi:MAG: site-specific integrase [Clostridia bacterium]|nr:site-specific integrase [Clostridia bacterium]